MDQIRKTILVIISCIVHSFLRGQSATADQFFHPDSLRYIVEVLASDSLKGRYSGTGENFKAAMFIADQFQKAGLKPLAGNNGFFMDVKPYGFNVVSAIQGTSKPGQVIIFSAHYDHIGTIKTNPFPGMGGGASVEKGDTIFNGANDNASGIAAVITLGKYFSALKSNERTLVFVAFTGEETGLFGSEYFASQCVADSIIAVINIEMIGRGQFDNSLPYITGDELSDLQRILNKNLDKYGEKKFRKKFFQSDGYKREQLFIRSDNYSFAKRKIPSHSIMLTSPSDEYYHNLNDESWTLNYDLMAKIILAISKGVTGLLNGTDTPRRINNY